MLPRSARLRRPAEFAETLRRGAGTRRSARPTLVVHVALADGNGSADATGAGRVGFAVSRAVGPAVVRNRVRRRLRHLMHQRLTRLPTGSRVVVRALPPAAVATWDQLGVDLDAALDRALSGGSRGGRP